MHGKDPNALVFMSGKGTWRRFSLNGEFDWPAGGNQIDGSIEERFLVNHHPHNSTSSTKWLALGQGKVLLAPNIATDAKVMNK